MGFSMNHISKPSRIGLASRRGQKRARKINRKRREIWSLKASFYKRMEEKSVNCQERREMKMGETAAAAAGDRSKFPAFPYEPYPIQLDFMNALYDALDRGGVAMLESPTGIPI